MCYPLLSHTFRNHKSLSFLRYKQQMKMETANKDKTNGNGTDNGDADQEEFKFKTKVSLEDIRRLHGHFSTRRNWNQFHSPRNVLLAMVGEVGEVAEHFQWKPDHECQQGLPGWNEHQKSALGEELSDVLIYLIRLADRCQIDLSQAVFDKMAKNETKYPVEKAYGSAKKYDQL